MVKSIYRKITKKLLDRLARGEKVDFTSSLIKKVHAADIAEIISNLSEERQLKIFQSLEEDRQGEVFSELPEEIQEDLVQEFDDEHLISLFKELPPDEAVDMLNMLGSEDQELLLKTLPSKHKWNLRRMLLYSEESAGGIMTPVVITAQEAHTAADVIEILRQHQKDDDTIINIFVVNEEDKLIGMVPLQTLVVSPPETKISQIMERDPIAVSVHEDQEVVAQIVSKYNLIAVPVVDEQGRLVGRVTPDDVLEVLQDEADEDAYLMAGMDSEEVYVDSAFEVARMRLPWLLTCLFGSMISAVVIGTYQQTLQKVVGLICFLPAICAMGGNSGLQTSTVTIRNLAYGQVFHKNVRKVVRRELTSGIIIGLVCGIFVGCIGGFWLKGLLYGTIIGCSMIFTILISTCTGLLFPLLFNRIGIDPAVASGPLITTFNDATSSLTYLTTAAIFLHYFHLV